MGSLRKETASRKTEAKIGRILAFFLSLKSKTRLFSAITKPHFISKLFDSINKKPITYSKLKFFVHKKL
jgi:hypothetical protein